MSDYSIIQELKRDGTLKLYHDYRSRSFLDFSGNGNHGVPSDCEFGGYGGLMFNAPTAAVTVADAPELQGTTWSLAVIGEFNEQSATGRLIHKRDAGGTQYEWYWTTTQFRINDGGAIVNIAMSATDAKFHAVTFTSGGTPKHYMDGVYSGDYSDVVTITADDAPLLIGNAFTLNTPPRCLIEGALIFNKVLTATEISQLYGELMS